ncbi:MAG TPA: zinc ribbon domain-containing protein [Nitrososphaera sp.]|jgi:hypothetical protein|nr:zinc ribbon domain-containing protein [Nitrososphaera sp.]
MSANVEGLVKKDDGRYKSHDSISGLWGEGLGFVVAAFVAGSFVASPELRAYAANTVFSTNIVTGQVIIVNPNGTSQKCSQCWVDAKEKLDLSERIFECRSCGLVLDRDINAARNILKLGLEQAHAETEPLLVRQRISKFQSRKQEAHVFRRG